MKQKLLLLISLILSLCLFASCSSDEQPAPVRDPAHALIGEDGTTPYVLIRPDEDNPAIEDSMLDLAASLEKKIGVKFKLGTDFVKAGTQFVENEFEILVGNTNREASLAIAAEIPRSRDWAVARIGTKIIIRGSDALDDAIAYFLENYVADGNIYIADGEKHIHTSDYAIDSLTIAGVPIGDYTVCYDSSSKASELAHKNFLAFINESCGYALKSSTRKPAKNVPAIIFAESTDESNLLDHRVFLDGTTLTLESGSIANPGDAGRLLTEHISSLGKTAVIDKLDLKQSGEDGQLRIADAEFLASLDKKADGMKKAVLNTKSEYTVGEGGKIYYFAADGNDNNDGLSPEKPKKSLDYLRAMTGKLNPGDVVLFKRGDWFRGWFTCAEGVTYSAYGEGDKPTICGSMRNYADPSLWIETEAENVWKFNGTLSNVGIILFDHDFELGNYEAVHGKIKLYGQDFSNGIHELTEDLSYWSNTSTGAFYLVSTGGNPGERFERIEIGQKRDTIGVSTGTNDVIIDNLRVTMTGSHGVGAGTVKNLTVRNCVFDWLGGSILKDFTRYGNAVQVFGGCDGYYVYNNWMYQIYDTGITHQYSATDTASHNVMNDVVYHDNLIEYVFWAIEYYNTSLTGDGKRETHNVEVFNNFCRFGGMGWGCAGREANAQLYYLGVSKETMSNYVTHDNIFDRCLGFLLIHAGDVAKLHNNTYVQHYEEKFARLSEKIYFFDSTAPEMLAAIGDTTAKIWYIMEPRDGSEK